MIHSAQRNCFLHSSILPKLIRQASYEGAVLKGAALYYVARRLGVDRCHWSEDGRLRDIYNAANDAAYTMMVLILFATRWRNMTAVTNEVITSPQQG